MIYKFTPQLEVDGKKEFSGHIEIEMLKYKERLQLLKEMNFSMDMANKYEVNANQLDSIIKMVEIAEKHIKAVDVIRLSDGAVFKSLDDLQYDQDGAKLMNEVASVVLNGVPMGKS